MRIVLCLLLVGFANCCSAQQGDFQIILQDPAADATASGIRYLNTVRMVDATYNGNYVGWSYANSNAELIDYLSSDQMRKQLEFSEAQNKEFKSLQKEYSKAFKDLYAKFPELKQKDLPSVARKELNKRVHLAGQKLRKEFSEKVRENLIPQQVKMVSTLRFKQAVQMFGFSHAITQAPFGSELKTTDKQKKEIAKIKKEANEAIQKKIAEMKAEAKEKMLKVLDRKQREKIKELEGEKGKPVPRLVP